jgi:hypothetical protein
MGLGRKVLLFVVGLMLMGLGAWVLTAVIFAYVFLPPLLRRNKGGGGQAGKVATSTRLPGRHPTRIFSSPLRVLGGILILLGILAIASGGTFSPFVFGVPGLILVFRPPRLLGGWLTSFETVDDSVFLHGRVLRFRWLALAEAKVCTRDVEGALSGMKERILVTSSPGQRIFLIFAETSISRGQAEEGLMERMHAAAKALGPLGIYLLPVSGKEALATSRRHGSRVAGLPAENLLHFLSSTDFGAMTLEAHHGFVTRFDVYERGDGTGGDALLSRPNNQVQAHLMLRELLHATAQRLGLPKVDRYATFLSSMAATEGETLGQRITETAQGSKDESLLVASLGGPQVEMSRSQLRTISRIYE